jgi:tetratricopeptide (TPR) repeat protein
MSYIKRAFGLLLFLLVVLSCSQSKEENDDQIKILFIGNSYTYFNSSPELVKALIQEKFPEQLVETQLISGGGMTLADHWQNESTIQTIRTGDWDYVVLQEQSKLGMAVMIDNDIFFGQTERFYEYARKFDTEIKKADAKTVFLMTWSVKDKPKEQAILSHAYTSIAKELKAELVPVGLVWDELRTNPKIELYADDGGHPSPLGSYLSAVTLYSTLMADDPIGLSGTISGHPLSSSGEPSPDGELLIDISKEEAKLIQEASWKVVHAIQESNDYPDIEQPKPSYSIPVLSKGEPMELKNMIGKWYGTSTYGSDYLGQIMEIKDVDGKPEASLSFYSPHVQDQMRVDNVVIKDNQLILTLYDSLRSLNSTVRISLSGGKMEGILESSGNLQMYKHLYFSRESSPDKIDLSEIELLMESYQSNILKEGYIKASLEHYEQYSKLIGETYKPDEFYLNAVGYNFLREDKVNDALNAFELAMVYYPMSVNAYDSYAEALIVDGRTDEAVEVYTRAYELAKKIGYENLAYIEENLNKLKNNSAVDLEGEATPPPPPPPSL